jgi:hypothetical protein
LSRPGECENLGVPVPRKLQFVAAQLGRKPGKGRVLSALLEISDLPGDRWTVKSQRTWRTGQTDNPSPAAIRARDAGSITAWRSFEEKGLSRWLWVQVTPTVSNDDAQAFIKDMPNRFLKNSGAIALRSERTIEGNEIPGAEDVWCHEQETTALIGDGISMLAAGRVGELVFTLAASSLAGGWSWGDVTAIAARQAQRLNQPMELSDAT